MSGPNAPTEKTTIGSLQTAKRAKLIVDLQKFSPGELRQVAVRKFTMDPHPGEEQFLEPRFWPTKHYITIPADKLPAMIALLQEASETIRELDVEEGV